jgi:hypothetical protein
MILKWVGGYVPLQPRISLAPTYQHIIISRKFTLQVLTTEPYLTTHLQNLMHQTYTTPPRHHHATKDTPKPNPRAVITLNPHKQISSELRVEYHRLGPWRIDPYTRPIPRWMRECKLKPAPIFVLDKKSISIRVI